MTDTGPVKRRVPTLQTMLLLVLAQTANAAAPDDPARHVQIAEHRLTLASRMIEKMEGADRDPLAKELEVLQTRFLENVDEQLAIDSTAFFNRVMLQYRTRQVDRSKTEKARHRARYDKKMSEVETFRRAYERLCAERGDIARAALDTAVFDKRVDRAQQLAGAGEYDDAYVFADGAYHQLIEAVMQIRDKETVEYRLEFASPAEEYEYEVRRFRSQKMLLDMMVAEREPGPDSVETINNYVDNALAIAAQAEQEAKGGGYAEALTKQEAAVQELTKAMRIVGIFF